MIGGPAGPLLWCIIMGLRAAVLVDRGTGAGMSYHPSSSSFTAQTTAQETRGLLGFPHSHSSGASGLAPAGTGTAGAGRAAGRGGDGGARRPASSAAPTGGQHLDSPGHPFPSSSAYSDRRRHWLQRAPASALVIHAWLRQSPVARAVLGGWLALPHQLVGAGASTVAEALSMGAAGASAVSPGTSGAAR